MAFRTRRIFHPDRSGSDAENGITICSPGLLPSEPRTVPTTALGGYLLRAAVRCDQPPRGRDISTHSRKAQPTQETVILPPLGNKEEALFDADIKNEWP